MDNQEAGDVIKGAGGLRKLRHADPRRDEGKEAAQGYAEKGTGDETMKKRNLFAEIAEGFAGLAGELGAGPCAAQCSSGLADSSC